MTETRVVHCKRDEYDVYIGRPSNWGNPFRIGSDGTRQEVIELYRRHLVTQPDLVARLIRELTGRRLGCWCHPLPCHGDVLVDVCDAQTDCGWMNHERVT